MSAGHPPARPFLVKPGERDPIWSLGGHFTTKLARDDADGAFSLTEAIAFRSTEPPLHVHSREDEAWYVLDGQMTFQVAGEDFVATAGCFVFAPRGLAHAFTVDREPTRVLVLAAPAGFEHFAADLGVPALGETPRDDLVLPTPDVLGPVAERYGIEVVGPPLRVLRGET
jgi:mannose-6-phosphate isomerase-like protein (cupin superfamily)